MSAWPKCPICGKGLFPSVRIAREASAGAGNRIRVYQAHGGYHITDQERNEKKFHRPKPNKNQT